MAAMYKVNEIFTSVQGEGILVGSPATFIRLQGCPVGCSWCDSGPLADELKGRTTNGLTRNTWGKGGEEMTVEAILEQVDRRHVIITGGEPTIWNLDPLIHTLRKAGSFIQLETSGFSELKGEYIPDHITISPKSNLGYNVPPNLLRRATEIKFVVDEVLTMDEVMTLWYAANTSTVICFMPEGCPPSAESIERTLKFVNNGPVNWNWRFTDRLQYRIGVR